MKFFAFIMAILVLALSVAPCADDGTVLKDTKAKTEITKTTDQQDHKENDACSPFCQCACCASISINHAFTSAFNLVMYSQRNNPAFPPKEVIEVALPIWQPPRLV